MQKSLCSIKVFKFKYFIDYRFYFEKLLKIGNFSDTITKKLNICLNRRSRKKSGFCLSQRVDNGVSSTKAACVIWTAEGDVKCIDVGLA